MKCSLCRHTSIPVAGRTKAWVCYPSLAVIAGSNSAGGVVVYLCCEVEVSVTS
jgi:hypothetical protein